MSDSQPRRRPVMPRWLTALLQLAVSAGLLAALVAFADWDSLRQAAHALSYRAVIGVMLFYVAAQAALVVRWRALIAALGITESWMRSWHSVFAGLFLSNFFPGTLGSDGLRIILLTRLSGSAPMAIGAVAYERAMQLMLYLLVVAAAALSPVNWLGIWQRAAIASLALAGAIGIFGMFRWLGMRSLPPSGDQDSWLRRSWLKLVAMVLETSRMQHRIRRHGRAWLTFWSASVGNVGLLFAVFFAILLDLGHLIPVPTIVLAVGIAAIATAVPISFAGVGIFETILVGILTLAGAPVADCLLAALIGRGVAIAGSMLGLPSALLLWRERTSKRPSESLD